MKVAILLLVAAAAAAAAAAPATARSPARADEVSIPFVNHRNAIRTFEATDDDILYLQDRQGRWYRAELGRSCFGLRWATAIGYDTRGRLSLGWGDSILAEGQRCVIASLTRSDPPPPRKRKKGA